MLIYLVDKPKRIKLRRGRNFIRTNKKKTANPIKGKCSTIQNRIINTFSSSCTKSDSIDALKIVFVWI